MFFSFDIYIPQGRWRGKGHRRKHDRAWDTITPVQPNMKQSFSLGSSSWSELAVHHLQTSSFPLDSSRILSHRRGFGTRISAQMGIEFILTHVGIFCGVQLTEIFNMSDCPDLSSWMLTLTTDTSTNYPEASCGGKQEHLARGGIKSASVILFWVWWVTLTLVPKWHFSPNSMDILLKAGIRTGIVSFFSFWLFPTMIYQVDTY